MRLSKWLRKGCSLVAVVNHNVTLVEPIALKPSGTAVRGCVTLKDGTPAVRAAATSYESAGSAEVSAESAARQVVAGPVPVNAAGCYVLPGVKGEEGLHILARYEQATESQEIPAAALDLRKHTAVNVVLPTSPPTISAFTAALNGKEVSQAQPGSTVAVEVKASSPNKHPLHYRWADGTGTPLPGDQANQQWTLPRTKSLNLIFVEVSDGHGGVARASVSVATGPVSVAKQTLLRRLNLNGGVVTKFGPLESIAFQHPGQKFIDPLLFMGCSDEPSCKTEAGNYYQAIGVFDGQGNPTGSYTSFKAWKAAWGFSDDPTKPAAAETRAIYYNNGDLQFGRDMHCIDFTGPVDADLVFTGIVINVCYVANYSDASGGPGGDPQTSVTNAETNTSPIAAVAMVNISQQIPFFLGFPPQFLWLNAPFVEFIVFTPPAKGDPIDAFVPNPEAVLDSEGAKAVPGVCIACHGGTYSIVTHNVSGARFLPFDTPSFLYDQVNNTFSEASQSAQFRTLNIIAKNASTDGGFGFANSLTSQTVRDLVDGWYSWCGGVDSINPNCSIDDVNHTFIPSGTCTSADAPATCGWNTGLNGLWPTAGLTLRRRRPPTPGGFRLVMKGLFDRSAAAAALILLSPLMAALAVTIRLSDGGPALFTQTRVGKDGRAFRIYKFRTMVVDAEQRRAQLMDRNDSDGVLFRLREDPG